MLVSLRVRLVGRPCSACATCMAQGVAASLAATVNSSFGMIAADGSRGRVGILTADIAAKRVLCCENPQSIILGYFVG